MTDLELKALAKARTVDPLLLPFPTSANDWRTWVSDKGQWIFIEKSVVRFIAKMFGFDNEHAFDWVGKKLLEWLQDPKNSSQLKPRAIWNFNFEGQKDKPINFGVFQNQCFVFMPRKTL